MISLTKASRLKAAGIAAILCLSATATFLPAVVSTMDAKAAVTIGTTLEADDTYTGYTADLASSDISTITFTLVADYTGNFVYGFGIGTATSPDYWSEVEEGEVAVTSGTTFTITIDVSDLELSYTASTSTYPGKYEFRNYYSGTGSVTVVSAEANASTTSTTTTTTTAVASTTTTTTTAAVGTADGSALSTDDVYYGYTADLATSGIDTITFTLVADYTGNFTYGFGIGTATSPDYWSEVAGDGVSVSVTSGETFYVTLDVSDLELSYNASSDTYPGKFEFRNYYSGTGSITVVSVAANQSVTSISGTTTDTSVGTVSSNSTDGAWGFTDNGDGTGTMWSTQSRQSEEVSDSDPFTLTAGYDEDYYSDNGLTKSDGDPTNAYEFVYSNFGLKNVGSEILIESVRATLSSSDSVTRFMYGGGMNVVANSIADTESAKVAAGVKESGGYWYNDMGSDDLEEYEEAGCEFGIEVGTGYDLLSSDGYTLGSYFSVVWDVPSEVQPYENQGKLSFQFWYGTIEAEEYTELESIDLVSAVITYTETQTFDFTGIASVDVNTTISTGDMDGVVLADVLPLDTVDANVEAVVFTLEVGSDLDKLVYAIGASVDGDWEQWSNTEDGDAWNYVLTDVSAGEVQIAWIVPAGTDIDELYGELKLGYWYGGKDGEELSSVTLKSVDLYYSGEELEEEEPDDEDPSDTLAVTLWGDADCDGDVDVNDIVLISQAVSGAATLTDQGALNADVDQNEVLSLEDALNVLRYLAGYVSLPV